MASMIGLSIWRRLFQRVSGYRFGWEACQNLLFPFMSRKSIKEVPAVKPTWSLPIHSVNVTPARTAQPDTPVSVALSEMLAYSQGADFTRLNLIGGKVLDVKETTDQIDRLVRAAASQNNFLPAEITLSD